MSNLILQASRKYPDLPGVTDDPKSHTKILESIREAIQTHERRTPDVLSSFVRVKDLIDLGFVTLEGSRVIVPVDFATGGGGSGAAADITVDDTNFDVLVGTDAQTVFESVDDALLRARGTGILSGGAVTGIGTTTASVALGSGGILDNSVPTAPVYTQVSWSAGSITGLSTTGLTYIYVDATGTIQSTTTAPSHDEYRLYIWLARVSVSGGVISAIAPIVMPLQQYGPQIWDVFRALGLVKRDMVVQPSGANLKVAITSGELYSPGANFHVDPLSPHEISYAAFDTAGASRFRMATQTGVIATNVTDLPVGSYDVAGTVTTIPGASSRATIFTVFRFPDATGNVRILYGQEYYTSIAAAITGLASYSPVLPSGFTNAMVLGYIIATKGATALNSADAYFVTTNKFGGKEGGVSVAGSLPATSITYDNTTSGMTATDVQDAIDELAATSILDDQVASEVPVTTTNYLSEETNVQTLLDVRFNPRKYFWWFDDLLGTLASSPFKEHLSGSGAITRTSTQGRPGIIQLSTASVTSLSVGVLHSSAPGTATTEPLIYIGGGELIFEASIRIDALWSGGDTGQYRYGFMDEVSGAPSNAVQMQYESGTSTWFIYARSGGTSSNSNSGAVTAATGWQRLKIVVNSAGTSASGYINGVLVGTVTTNLPSAGLTWGFQVQKSAGTTAMITAADWMNVRQKFSSERV